MNIQEAAAQGGLTADTIRFYECKGVLPRPPPEANGYRNCTADHVRTPCLAKDLRHLAVRLEAVAPMIAVAHSGTCGEVGGAGRRGRPSLTLAKPLRHGCVVAVNSRPRTLQSV